MNGVKRIRLGLTIVLAVFMVVIMAGASRAYAEETVFDNHWKVLTLIYTDVHTDEFDDSFSKAEVDLIKEGAANLPDNFKRLTGGHFLIDKLDIEVITDPITTVSGEERKDLTYGPGQDIDFDNYLEAEDYDFVYVFAPLRGYPGNSGWYGLGGAYYYYNGRRVYYAIAADGLTVGKASYPIYDDYFDTRLGVMVHEMLHGIETNSRTNGITDFQPIHDAEQNGYESSDYGEWFDWYYDCTQDKIKNGAKGFSEGSFFIEHAKRGSYPESISISRTSVDMNAKETIQLTATVLPEDAQYQSVVFRSSDPSVATVTPDGKVTAHFGGEVVITASPNNSTLEAKCTLNITGPEKPHEIVEPVEPGVIITDDGQLKVKENKDGTYTIVGATGKVSKYLYLENYIEVNDDIGYVTKIAPYAFKRNKRIREIVIQDSRIKTIGKGAFYAMPNLRYLSIEMSKIRIPANMCRKCKRLKNIELMGKIKSVGSKSFTGIAKKPKVYVRKKTAKKFKKKINKMIKYKVKYY